MSATGSERWRAMLATLLNDDARSLLAETTASEPPSAVRRERALARLEQAGLVQRRGDAVVFDAEGVRAMLVPVPRATGVDRFLDGDGRIDRYPANADERRRLLEWVVERALPREVVLTEREVGERLEPYAPGGDVAVLRRYLVDHELLERTRSGSEYARVAAST